MTRKNKKTGTVLVLILGAAFAISYSGTGAYAQTAPRFHYDPTWPEPLPNLWKLGGVTGLAVDSNDNVWVYNRPNDAIPVERRAEPGTDIAVCCVRPPSMIHLDKNGNVIGSFDAPQGHGMAVDDDGFVYLGQDTVRKYDPETGQIVAEVAKTPEKEPDEDAAAIAAFRQQYPPETPMIVGGLEEIRIVEEDNEMWVADNYLGGRVLVFDLDTFEFKRGWGAYGKPLAEISTDDADRAYTPNGPMAADFVGHLTLNVSNDGLVYAADRNGNRIHVTTKDGEFLEEFVLAPGTGAGGSTGGYRVLARCRAALSVHLGPYEQQDLVPQPRRWGTPGTYGQDERRRRSVLRPPHDRRRLRGQYLYGRGATGRARPAVRAFR